MTAGRPSTLDLLRPSQIRQIVETVEGDPRASIRDVSAATGLSKSIVWRALRALRAQGSIPPRQTLTDRVVQMLTDDPTLTHTEIAKRIGSTGRSVTMLLWQARENGRLPAYQRDATWRARTLAIIRTNPGILSSEIAKRLGIPRSDASAIVAGLRRSGDVEPRNPVCCGAWPVGGGR